MARPTHRIPLKFVSYQICIRERVDKISGKGLVTDRLTYTDRKGFKTGTQLTALSTAGYKHGAMDDRQMKQPRRAAQNKETACNKGW